MRRCSRFKTASSHHARWLGSFFVAWVLSGCFERPSRQGPDFSSEFGVFFGGQVQQRKEIPFELDATRQTQGFRVRLEPPPKDPVEVRWELALPGAGRPRRDSQGRLARPRKVLLGQARWRPNEPVFEQALPFTPGEPLGLWSIRVLVGSRVVLDRPFWVYDADERSRGAPLPFESDAGF